jgi:flagellar basal body-associated protein FliL
MKMKRLLFIAIFSMFLLASCASAQVPAPTSAPQSRGVSGVVASSNSIGMVAAPTAAPAAEAPSTDNSGGTTDATSGTIKQMVIQNASLTILVDDPAKSLDAIMKMAKDMGGFTVSSNTYQTYTSSGDQVPTATVTIRVPSDQLDTALDKIKALTGDASKFVTDESVSGTDITQEYTDLQSRLTNLEQASDELTAMYDKATKADDILAIYNQKLQITEQIEVLKGQIQYDEQASAKSAISVQLNAKATAQPITVAGWQPTGIARQAVQALLNFFKGFVNFLIWLVILILPILIVIGVPLYFLIRWLVRRKKAKRNQTPPLPLQK